MKCHGSYKKDQEAFPVYAKIKWIPLKVVKTDEDRLCGIESFVELVRKIPLKDILIDDFKGRGYMAPCLEGIWARFPYLHHASASTIMDLLSKSGDRPKVFSVRKVGGRHRFDEYHFGLKLSREERNNSA
jgi:hypothetical protein